MKRGVLILALGLQVACVSSGKFKDLQSEHEDTKAALSKLEQEKKQCLAEVNELETLTSQLERKLGQASDDKESLRASVVQMKEALSELTKRKQETEKRLAEFKSLLSSLEKFTQTGQVSVKIVDGRMVVAMPGDVLFPSGSAKLSGEGQQTVESVAKILKDLEGKDFQIEGHTDNVPIKTSQYQSNWELASQRAINVVKAMVDAGFPQERVSAASFASTRPVSSNDDPEGRKSNRRIEIVVVPDMSTLPGYDELKSLSSEGREVSSGSGEG